MIESPELRTVADFLRPVLAPKIALRESVVEFAHKRFYIPETSSTIYLEPFQQILLSLAFDEDFARSVGVLGDAFQMYVYSTVKKSGKTTIASLVARWVAETYGNHNEVYCMANDLEQARGRIYQGAIRSIELDPAYDPGKRLLPGTWRVIERDAKHIPSNSVLRAVSMDYKGEAGSNPTATFWSELWGYCVSADTEILTAEGWKRADEIFGNEAFAALMPDGTMRYEIPQSYHRFKMTEPMVRFQHRRGDFLVTPNHRVYGRYITHRRYREAAEARGWWFERADELADGKYSEGWLRSDCVGLDGETAATQEEIDRAKLYGYYISEGCVLYYEHKEVRRPTGVAIAQDAIAHYDTWREIGDVSERLGYFPACDARGWKIHDTPLALEFEQFGKSHEKYVPDFIKFGSISVQRAFLMAYLEGDGWRAGSDGWQAETTSKRLADDLMQIGLHCGYVPRYMGSRKRSDSQREIHRISLSSGPISWSRYGGHWSREAYNGDVFCPSLENGIFYIRRNGKCTWTGNTLEASKRMWAELTPVPTRPKSFRWVETYAGYTGESELLQEQWDLAKQGRQLTKDEVPSWPYDEDLLPIWVNPQARVFAYIDQGEIARRMPWQSRDYYASQRSVLRPNDFDRLHLNLWTSAVSSFIPMEWWDRLGPPATNLPPLVAGSTAPAIIAADASVTGDCTGLLLLTRHPNRSDGVAVRLSEMWQPSPGYPLDYSVTIEPTIRRWATGHIHPRWESCATHSKVAQLGPCTPVQPYNVVQIAYDAYQLHDLMTRIRNEGITWCKSFSQNADRMLADKMLYDLIREQRLAHNGDPNLRQHMQNAGAKSSKDEDTKMRLVKKASGSKIDLAVCASMGAFECLRLNI